MKTDMLKNNLKDANIHDQMMWNWENYVQFIGTNKFMFLLDVLASHRLISVFLQHMGEKNTVVL